MYDKKTVYGIEAGDYTSVTREDSSVWIQATSNDEGLEIFIGPSLFPALRAAMDAAERPWRAARDAADRDVRVNPPRP